MKVPSQIPIQKLHTSMMSQSRGASLAKKDFKMSYRPGRTHPASTGVLTSKCCNVKFERAIRPTAVWR
ncbi:unnamed protein product [Strongylus vulgaris]|uniref:Uncharacterized protein n=1 Tax=Strongylus vulgaris TaxID=40348 RepID=A0A3P7JMH4_STRVU|nr:unnamed protein product [Strongylus vulgaris]